MSKRHRLLLIDDDPVLREMLTQYLERTGYAVRTAASGDEGLASLRASPPHLIVLDVALPCVDGWDVLRQVRTESTVPVVMLTASTEEPDVLRGFALGADDYIGKPFSFAQLEARIRAVLHRASRGASDAGELRHGDLIVDLESHRVRRGSRLIKLTPTEFKLLVALMERPDRVVPPDELVRRVWGDACAGEVDYVRRYVWYLRQKIEDDPETPRYIINERNVGYYFAAQ